MTFTGVGYVLCASPTYLRKFGSPQSISELQSHRCINYISPRTGRYRQWDLTFQGQTESIHIPGTLSLNDVSVVRDSALAGAGIAYLADFLVADAIASQRLKLVMPDYLHEGPPYYMVYLKRQMPTRCRVLQEFLIDLLPENPAWRERLDNEVARALNGEV